MIISLLDSLSIFSGISLSKERITLESVNSLPCISKVISFDKADFESKQNIEQTISSARPPVFWKDKEIIKKQIFLWVSQNLKKLIYKLTEIELQIKKNYNNPINLITDFILNQMKIKASN